MAMNSILANILKFADISVDAGCNSVASSYTKSNGLGVFCFSKERPYQLHQLLLSIEACFDVYPTKIVVLYCPGAYQNEYDVVFSCHSRVAPLLETTFETNFIEEMHRLQSKVEHVMFCVDDLVFTGKFSPMSYATTLNQGNLHFYCQFIIL